MLKRLLFILCIVIAQNLSAKSVVKLSACEIMLIDTLEAVPGCGDVIFSTAAKCMVYSRKGVLNKKDTMVFYIVCPEGYGDGFWVKGNSFEIKYEQFNKDKRYSFIVYQKRKDGSFIPAQKKYKNAGIIKEANKR